MKNFSYNLLKQLNAKKADKGFTLIELLVVIIIIGILSAIALPAFLNQASKAKQSEAKQALGAVNRGQQAYRLENVEFAPTIAFLALGLETDTNNYLYSDTIGGTVGSFDSGDYTVEASIFADAKDDAAVRTYEASVGASIDPEGNATTITVLCEGLTPGDVPAIVYTPVAGTTEASFACGADAKQL